MATEQAARGVDHYLAIHPFLRNMQREQVDAIAACSTAVRWESGDVMFQRAEVADRFYLIRTGMVSLELSPDRHNKRTIQMLKEGDVLGWSWLFESKTWAFDARAQTPVQAISIDADCLRQLCDADHELGYILMQRIAGVMADRLQATRHQLLDR